MLALSPRRRRLNPVPGGPAPPGGGLGLPGLPDTVGGSVPSVPPPPGSGSGSGSAGVSSVLLGQFGLGGVGDVQVTLDGGVSSAAAGVVTAPLSPVGLGFQGAPSASSAEEAAATYAWVSAVGKANDRAEQWRQRSLELEGYLAAMRKSRDGWAAWSKKLEARSAGTGAKDCPLKKVPTWAWLAGGGAGLFLLLRRREEGG